jgi:hypothetical protein
LFGMLFMLQFTFIDSFFQNLAIKLFFFRVGRSERPRKWPKIPNSNVSGLGDVISRDFST